MLSCDGIGYAIELFGMADVAIADRQHLHIGIAWQSTATTAPSRPFCLVVATCTIADCNARRRPAQTKRAGFSRQVRCRIFQGVASATARWRGQAIATHFPGKNHEHAKLGLLRGSGTVGNVAQSRSSILNAAAAGMRSHEPAQLQHRRQRLPCHETTGRSRVIRLGHRQRIVSAQLKSKPYQLNRRQASRHLQKQNFRGNHA